jgi:hypothetical protein
MSPILCLNIISKHSPGVLREHFSTHMDSATGRALAVLCEHTCGAIVQLLPGELCIECYRASLVLLGPHRVTYTLPPRSLRFSDTVGTLGVVR